jgi:hypothetical protein
MLLQDSTAFASSSFANGLQHYLLVSQTERLVG